MDAIGAAFNGLQRNTALFNASNARIANGEIEAEPIVEGKIAEAGIKANLASLKSIFEVEETVLDILA